MMRRRAFLFGYFLIPIFTLNLLSCSKKEEPPPNVIPLVTESQPATQPAIDRDALLSTYAKKRGIDLVKAKDEAVKQGVFEKFGQEELTPEEFAKWVSYMWSVDPLLRIRQLEALADTNDLFDKLQAPKTESALPENEPKKKTAAAATPPLPQVPSRDVDLEMVISRTILDQFLFQERVVDGLHDLGALNVMGMKAADDCSFCEGMMQELLALVAPPAEPSSQPSTLPSSLPAPPPASLPSAIPPGPPSSSLWSLLEKEALAQTQTPSSSTVGKSATAKPPTPAMLNAMKRQVLFKNIPPVKVAKAPLLLARAYTFKLTSQSGPMIFTVLQSPFQAIVPQFSALPADQFHFKATPSPDGVFPKRTVGEEYRSGVEQNVARLAALPSRDQPQWYEMASALNELLLANKLSLEFVQPMEKATPTPPLPALP